MEMRTPALPCNRNLLPRQRRGLLVLVAIALVYMNISAQAMLGPKGGRVPILTYHRVVEEIPVGRGRRVPYVLREDFEEQLRALQRRGYRSITFEELGDCFSRRHGLAMPSEKVVIITFDDGWRDNYEVAFPLLLKYGFRATFFLTAGRVGKPGYMNIGEIREMRRAGMEFGSHTLTHPRLTLIGEEEAWREIYHSKILLEGLLGEEIDTFSYPYGDYNKRIEDMVRRAGYIFACSSEFGDNDGKADEFRLKRILMARSGPLSKVELCIATNPWLLPVRTGVYWLTSTRLVNYAIRLTLPGRDSAKSLETRMRP